MNKYFVLELSEEQKILLLKSLRTHSKNLNKKLAGIKAAKTIALNKIEEESQSCYVLDNVHSVHCEAYKFFDTREQAEKFIKERFSPYIELEKNDIEKIKKEISELESYIIKIKPKDIIKTTKNSLKTIPISNKVIL